MSNERITHSEIIDIFGDKMPIEAAILLFHNYQKLSTEEMRVKLKEMASARSTASIDQQQRINTLIEQFEHLWRIADELAESNRQLLGAGKALLALCESAGVADNILADIFPDNKNRSGETILDVTKEARRTMNEARAVFQRNER